MTFLPPESGHADELLSALADDELTDAERTWTQAHLGECAGCQDEFDAIAATRSALRTMPPLRADEVIGSFLARHRAVIRTGVVFLGATAMVLGALSLTAAVIVEPVMPDLDALVAAHEHGAIDEMPATKMRAVDRVSGLYVAPTEIGADKSLARHALFDGDDLTSVVYRSATAHVSVFELPGRVAWGEIAEGTRLTVGDNKRAWQRAGSPTVLMADVGHLVIVVVSDDEDAAKATLAAMPESRRDSWRHHLHDAGQRLADVFSFQG